MNDVKSNTKSDMNLLAFKAIVNFVNDLASEYRSKHKPLKFYQRLINQTQIAHKEAIQKHINAFRSFCIMNRDLIIEKNSASLNESVITYSKRVYIDMNIIFELADDETTPIIWNHILTISAILDPVGKAKDLLRKNADAGKTGESEANFLTDIISKVESNIDPNANPMEAVSSMLSSGVLTDLLGSMQSGMKNGEMDMSKLMGAVQGMVSSLGDNVGDDPDATNAMGMLNNMTSMMSGVTGGGGGEPPNMGNIMQMMVGMMGSMGVPPPVSQSAGDIEDVSGLDSDEKT